MGDGGQGGGGVEGLGVMWVMGVLGMGVWGWWSGVEGLGVMWSRGDRDECLGVMWSRGDGDGGLGGSGLGWGSRGGRMQTPFSCLYNPKLIHWIHFNYHGYIIAQYFHLKIKSRTNPYPLLLCSFSSSRPLSPLSFAFSLSLQRRHGSRIHVL